MALESSACRRMRLAVAADVDDVDLWSRRSRGAAVKPGIHEFAASQPHRRTVRREAAKAVMDQADTIPT